MQKSNPFRLRVYGENALFSRPEMKVERVSYDVLTPSAARGIVESILWKPALRYRILQIDVLKPIRWESVRRNEVGKVFSKPTAAHMSGENGSPLGLFIDFPKDIRQQRAGLLLRDVDYIIHFDFELTEKAGEQDSVTKFTEMFIRRASKGSCFHRPYFGCREFPVNFEFIPQGQESESPIMETKDLGWMLYDIDFSGKEKQPSFFHAQMKYGIIDLRNVEVRL